MENQNPKSQEISSDDKLLSFVAHLSCVFGTFVLPIILYQLYKSKSKFIAFNSLQALYYQILWFIVLLILIFASTIFFIATDQTDKLNPDVFSDDWFYKEVIMYLAMGCILLIQGGYGLLIGIRSYKGNIAKYFLVGNLAFDKVYNTVDKTSFNLNINSQLPQYNEKRSSKSMI